MSELTGGGDQQPDASAFFHKTYQTQVLDSRLGAPDCGKSFIPTTAKMSPVQLDTA